MEIMVQRGNKKADMKTMVDVVKKMASDMTGNAPEMVSGLGDEAFWGQINPTNGQLHIVMGTDFLTIHTWGKGQGAGTLPETRKLAAVIVERFKKLSLISRRCRTPGGMGDTMTSTHRIRAAFAGSALAIPTGPAVEAAGQATNPCAGQAACIEVPAFVATVTDFRPGTVGAARMVSATIRFTNKTARALVVGYVDASGVATDDRGNRYTVAPSAQPRMILRLS